MLEGEKDLLENVKNLDISKLFMKSTYAAMAFNDSLYLVYIINKKENQKFDIYFPNIVTENMIEVPINCLYLLGDNDYPEEIKMRKYPVNFTLNRVDSIELKKNINKYLVKYHIFINSNNYMNNNPIEKDNNSSTSTTSSNNIQNNNNDSIIQDKNGKIIDISGFMTFQLLQGTVLDCFSIINDKIKNNKFTIKEKELLESIIDIIIYLAKLVKTNLDKYKAAYYNRRLLIVSQIHAILVCFDSLLINLTPNFDAIYNSSQLELDKKLAEIAGLVYEIILCSKNKNQIPLKCLITFIKLIYSGYAKESIENYNKKEIYEILNEHMKNLDKNELLNLKKDSQMREMCNSLVSNLFENHMDSYIDETYYSYLLSCLKCNNLEKKMNALSEINNLIKEFQKEKKVNNGFKNFIEKNNILDIFFDESTHEELIKRCTNLFSYMAKYNCLSDNIIEKIIQRQSNNELMKKILIEILSELPKEKKDLLFSRLSQGLKFDIDNTNNIEYILNLTQSCFESSDIDSDDNKDKDNDIEIDIVDTVNYYGLNIIFDYIIKDFNDKKRYDENNVDIALNNFVDTLLNIFKVSSSFNIEDVFFFIEQFFENIKFNNKHNSIIQSIKIIHRLFNALGKKKNKNIFIKNLKILDEKYDIITLLINDLIRYMKILPNDYSNENCENNIYEGIYPHYINVEQRLNLISFFFKKNLNNYGLILEGKKHLEKIYEVFKFEKFKNERKKFYSNITKNIDLIDNKILLEFYQDILKNKEELDLKSINDNETTKLIIETFKQINFNKKSILHDGRNIRIVDGEVIEGIDMLFDLLTQNLNLNVQEKISQLLCDICLSHKNYNDEKISDFWKNYFNKINLYLVNIINTNDKIALTGIIKLINKIYISSSNCYGKIPDKRDIQTTKEKCYYIYNFIKENSKKEWRNKVGINDNIIDLRWRIGYHFNIRVNNVAFIDIDGNIYNLNNDFENFIKIFSDERYYCSKEFEYIRIKDIKFGLLEMKDNPKFLIETNDKIYNILINNLKIDLNNDYSIEIENKQKIWNIISKLPKKFYFENKLKKYGDKEQYDDKELFDIFNINQIYLLTYSLQCFYYGLFDKINEEKEEEKEEKKVKEEEINNNEYLKNFIDLYHIDKIIFNKLLEIKIDKNYCYPIQIECLKIIIEVLQSLEKYKENQMILDEKKNVSNDENLYNNLLKKMTEIISNLLGLDFNNYKSKLMKDNDNLNDEEEEEDEEDEEDKDKKISEDINNNFKNLIENIFSFIDAITKNKKFFMNFILDDKNLFIKIFINDYIKSENEAFKKVIANYLLKNCEKNNETLQKYLEIILTEEIFNYIIKNDESGKYFQVINSILKEIFDKKDNKEITSRIESKHIEQAKKLIDIILNYIQQEFDNKDKLENKGNEQIEEKQLKKLFRNNESLKDGIISFLSNILNIEKYLLKYIITKVDICDFFLNKCILRKCVERPLEAKEPFCFNNQSKLAVFKLLLNILKNLEEDNNYMKILEVLDNKNKLGFWKTFNTRNWEIESKDIQKGKYIGLKNMTSTCYLNSIIQQLFMIPTFRETILKIENNSEKNVLYELQLLFSALKIYEFPYYNPKSFVLINNLNFYEQMDVDEYYSSLIDKIEKDIKNIFSKNEEISGKVGIKNEKYKYKDIFNYFFGIKVLDELQFVDCGHKRFNEFCYNNIQLEIKDFNNMQESLKNYFKTEVMDGDNKINCEQCNTKRTCHKHLLLKSLPNILVICLKRFEFDYDSMHKYKLNKYFEFPLQLEMKDYLIENHIEKNTEYELTGITIHFGVSDFGHYYDLIKGINNKWYKFNDTNVNEFKEEDIAKEAFGEKEISEDDSDMEKENGRNNAYILFYTKKGNESEKIKNETDLDLALPPYSKYSNIKNDIIDKINIKLYKSWILNNIFSSSYLNFVMGLLKIDLAKLIDSNIEKMFPQTTRNIRNEGYMKNIKENLNKEKKKDKDNISFININNNSDKIFQFGLRYFFNVILRISRKNVDKSIANNINRFKDLIKIYIITDINKAGYILEEFSNTEAIEEYLVYCPNGYSSNDCIEIIFFCIDLLSKYVNLSDENSIIFLFLNTYTTFIYNNYWRVNLQNVNHIFYKLININENIMKQYLESKNINNWAINLINNAQCDLKIYFNENDFPTINSNHSILTDKALTSEDNFRRPQSDENDIYDQHFYSKTRDPKSNMQFKEYLKNLFFQ